MVVGLTTTCAISAYHHYIQHNVIKFVTDLQRVGWFLRLKVELNTIILTLFQSIIKIRCLLYFCTFVFLGDTLTSNNILFRVMSCNLSLTLDHPIICKTIKHIDQSDNSSLCVLSFYTYRLSRLITNWSVENMNLNITHTRLHVSPKKISLKRYNKHINLIRLYSYHTILMNN